MRGLPLFERECDVEIKELRNRITKLESALQERTDYVNKLATEVQENQKIRIAELEQIEHLARGLCISFDKVSEKSGLTKVQYSRLKHLYKVLFTKTKSGE